MRWHHSGLPGPPPSPAVTLQDADDTAGHRVSESLYLKSLFCIVLDKMCIYNQHIQWLQKVGNL